MSSIPKWISACLGMSETPKTRQVPEFLKDVIPLIFSQAKLGDIARLGQTCKDWNRMISPYLKQLKKQVITLIDDCNSHCYIRCGESYGMVTVGFLPACCAKTKYVFWE